MTQEYVEVTVPQAGTETEASVEELLCAVGDLVEEGQVLVVIEMDKAVVEVVAPVAGEVVEVVVTEGQSVTPTDLICRLKVQG